MRNTICIVLFILISLPAFSQDSIPHQVDLKRSITIGILQGGGSLVGFDIEALIYKNFGIQFGAGFFGFGAGMNLHFKQKIPSSFVSLQYWHQGLGMSYTQSVLGPSFVYRGKKWFTAQLGFGFALEQGPAWPSTMKQPDVMLTYAIGAYIPF